MKEMKITMPPAAVTQSSIAVVWDRTEPEYEVYVNGSFYEKTNRGDSTIEGLMPDTEYEITVRGRESAGSITARTRVMGGIFDVRDFGAAGDGVTVNTKAIQAAIDACAKDGVVLIPEGIFVSGAIYLKSDMSLRLDEGAVLLGSTDAADYPIYRYRWEGRECDCYSSLVNVKFDTEKRFKNITIEGKGKIDASGVALFIAERAEGKAQRGRAVCIRNTDGVYYKDITVKQSPAWCVHTIYSTGISANNIRVYTKYDEERSRVYGHIFNGDGFDPDSCKDVYVFNSVIASQDDCIAIKSGRDEEGRAVGIPTENVRITDCRFLNGFGVAVGSEVSGGVKNVLVRDCTFTHVYSIGSVKSPRGRGNVIENITYENCEGEYQDDEFHDCEWFRGGIYVDNFYSVIDFDSSAAEPVTDATPKIKNVTFRNINMKSRVSNAIYLAGLPESPLEDITLINVTAEGPKGMKAYNIHGLVMEDVTVITPDEEKYHYENVIMANGDIK